LLGTGEITVPINTGRDIKASASATAKIKKAGGSVLS
jgi:ribosomal protein L15